ncbi:MAG: fasciclin domain-containing protein [Bacteroidota bacterium]
MNKILQRVLVLFAFSLLITSCRKKAFDEYYGRPETLEPPIYQVLEAKGKFKSLLATIDKSGYTSTLSTAGYWTFFAPNDSAFSAFFKERGVTGVDALDSGTCRQIITYCLAYNAFKKDRVDDFQSTIGWVPNSAYKRRTANYTYVYDGNNTAGTAIKVIASNRNNNAAGVGFYIDADNNNKNIPIFTDTFFASRALTATDYNYFYPTSTFSGFNVMDAQVVAKDIAAENGVIHEVNKVLMALPSIDQYLASKPEYSEFKKLFDKFLVQYILNPTVTNNYQNRTGSTAQVFTKVFNGNLAFSPNNENFLKQQDNDAQTNGYTLFVPTNAVLLNYINTVLLENYTSLETMPVNIIYDFVNAHMWQSTVWPSKFNSTLSYLNEEARFNPTADIVDKKILSNGLFYGASKVQQANVFTTVYGRVYLDPKYSMMQSLMDAELKVVTTNPAQKYTIFMMSNAAIAAAGYSQNPLLSANVNLQWTYVPPGGGTTLTGATAYNRLLRIINMSVVPTPAGELDNLSGSGVAQSYGGEFIKYNANSVQASGNVFSNTSVNVTGSKTSLNGKVYYCDKLLTFSDTTISSDIKKLALSNVRYSPFWRYLSNSAGVYNSATGEIQGVANGLFYTVFIPDSVQIRAAVNAGLLPGTGTAPNKVPNYTPTLPAEQQLVVNFIQYHILNKICIGTDGKTSGSIETVLKNNGGDAVRIFVTNTTPNNILLTDAAQPTARYGNVIIGVTTSNFLSNRCNIHLIDNYLKYTL